MVLGIFANELQKRLTLKKKDMKASNIQDRKLNIIEKLILLNDEDVFKQIEEIINSSMRRPKMNRLTKEELINRAQLSNRNIEKDEVLTQEEVEKLSKRW